MLTPSERQDLDRWITREEDDGGYTEWLEEVTDCYDSEVFRHMELTGWFDGDVEEKWLWKLWEKQYDPATAAGIISRAYKKYFLNEKPH